MKFGLDDSQYKFILETVVYPLEELGATVWCYGSRARGDFQKFSDLDLMVESEKDYANTLGAIREELENSNFPYKVDLVSFSEFAESYKAKYQKEKVRFS